MKKSVVLSIVGVLLVLGVGISFAYYVSQVLISGDGSDVSITPGDMIKVTYDAGDGMINSDGMVPGSVASKDFSVTITPTEEEKEATYSIILNITENTFVKCDDSNYNELTNACQKDAEELVYRLKDSDNQVIAEDSLIGATGEIKLVTETKTVDTQTTYNYTLEIEFIETGYDQNHNQNKAFNGSVEVKFDEIIFAKDTILTNTLLQTKIPDFSKTAQKNCDGIENCEETNGLYQSEDNDGVTYYFRGAVNNNWVKFGKWNNATENVYYGYYTDSITSGGNTYPTLEDCENSYSNKNCTLVKAAGADMYWRIVRINGDRTIRMIYAGIDPFNNSYFGMQSIGTSLFSESKNSAVYTGFMYDTNNLYGLTSSNKIKNYIDDWYLKNLLIYNNYIDIDQGFCGDREVSSGNGMSEKTRYVSEQRWLNPTFKCWISNDLYTIEESRYGNNSLKYPVGLITMDEIIAAGGVYYQKNSSFYLKDGGNFWTMTPYMYSEQGENNLVPYLYTSSENSSSFAMNGYQAWGHVRPVINLRADIQLTGTGTANDPYVIVGIE